jgi:protein-L-isoaspartate(D-aspartate) O-methyltransferase
MRLYLLTALLFLPVPHVSATSQQDALDAQRARMLEEIAETVVDTRSETGVASLSDEVSRAMATTPRHEFVPDALRENAYENRPLPIGHGQTISQPYIVALMTELLDVDPQSAVLEIGTGSGYQAAILAELAERVYTIEIIEPLGIEAQRRLERLGYENVVVKIADGYFGWPEHAPFDAIVVTAAAGHIPPPLVAQLAAGGKLVIPVGTQFAVQQLVLVSKNLDGSVTTQQVLPVRFVPLTGGH